MFIANAIILVSFTIDMIINFFLGYKDYTGIMETRLRKIIPRYLKTWFLVDLLYGAAN